MKNKKTNENSRGRLKVIIITSLTFIIMVSLLALYMYYPQLSAKKELNKIYGMISDGKYDFIVLSQVRPFSSGSFEQMLYDFELRLEGDNEKEFVSSFLSSCSTPKAGGYSIQTSGFWDMQVSVFSGDERFVFYVYSDGVYVTEKYRRFDFICSSELYDTVNAIKEAQYQG